MYKKTNEKQMDWNRGHCLRQKCKKSPEWNEIYIEKIQTKTRTKIQTEKNEAKVD